MAMNDLGSDEWRLIDAGAEGKKIPCYSVPERFTRITRNRHTDIEITLYRKPLTTVKFTIAYTLDDFETDKGVRYTLVVPATMVSSTLATYMSTSLTCPVKRLYAEFVAAV